MTTRLRVYLVEGEDGWWSWRLVGGNGRAIAVSPEARPSKRAARRGFYVVRRSLRGLGLIDEIERPRAGRRRKVSR